MSVQSIGDVAGRLLGGGRKRPGDPNNPTDKVRSHSYDTEDRRSQPWRRIGDGTPLQGAAFKSALIATAKWLADRHRAESYAGDHRFQNSYVDVLKALLAPLDYKTGRLDASWAAIKAGSAWSHGTVSAALDALEAWGFIAHVRRSVRVEAAEGEAGPRRKQTSNAWYFDCRNRMPGEIWGRLWGAWRRELAQLGKRAKARALGLLNSFNAKATPSPRASAKRAAEATPAVPTRWAEDDALNAVLTRMARTLGIEGEAAASASP